jgi:thiol-disulfide isomerase/thioredoxin
MNVHIVTKEQDLKKWIEEPNRLVFLFYTSVWCEAGQNIKPVFEKIANDYPDVICIKIDVDRFEEFEITRHNAIDRWWPAITEITNLPSFKIYYNCHKLSEFVGGESSNLELELSKARDIIQIR